MRTKACYLSYVKGRVSIEDYSLEEAEGYRTIKLRINTPRPGECNITIRVLNFIIPWALNSKGKCSLDIPVNSYRIGKEFFARYSLLNNREIEGYIEFDKREDFRETFVGETIDRYGRETKERPLDCSIDSLDLSMSYKDSTTVTETIELSNDRRHIEEFTTDVTEETITTETPIEGPGAGLPYLYRYTLYDFFRYSCDKVTWPYKIYHQRQYTRQTILSRDVFQGQNRITVTNLIELSNDRRYINEFTADTTAEFITNINGVYRVYQERIDLQSDYVVYFYRIPVGTTYIEVEDGEEGDVVYIPTAGYLPGIELDRNMSYTNLEIICEELVRAVAEEEEELLVSYLAGLLECVGSQPGFSYDISRYDYGNNDGERDILRNACLAICIAKAIRYLQDRAPTQFYELRGLDFTPLLRSLQRLLLQSLDPVSFLARSRVNNSEYSVADTDLDTSYSVCIALTDLIDIEYDYLSHLYAARLYLELLNLDNGSDWCHKFKARFRLGNFTDPLFENEVFDLYAIPALTYNSFVNLQQANFFPNGYLWGDERAPYQSNTALGSILAADSSLAFGSFLKYFMYEEGKTLYNAQGDALLSWSNVTFPKYGKVSDGFWSSWLYDYVNRPRDTAEAIIYLTDLYGFYYYRRENEIQILPLELSTTKILVTDLDITCDQENYQTITDETSLQDSYKPRVYHFMIDPRNPVDIEVTETIIEGTAGGGEVELSNDILEVTDDLTVDQETREEEAPPPIIEREEIVTKNYEERIFDPYDIDYGTFLYIAYDHDHIDINTRNDIYDERYVNEYELTLRPKPGLTYYCDLSKTVKISNLDVTCDAMYYVERIEAPRLVVRGFGLPKTISKSLQQTVAAGVRFTIHGYTQHVV